MAMTLSWSPQPTPPLYQNQNFVASPPFWPAAQKSNSVPSPAATPFTPTASPQGPPATIPYDSVCYVALDAEFVGTGIDGLVSSLARVSLSDYHGEIIYDSFCAPDALVTDYRSWVSGIREADLLNAPAFSAVQQQVQDLIRGKVLVGHAVHNDLEVLGLSHPEIHTRDTATYLPLQKLACTNRPSLRALARLVLNIDVQIGEHSSVEDAKVTMLIFRRYQQQWEASLPYPAPLLQQNHGGFFGPAPISSNQELSDVFVATPPSYSPLGLFPPFHSPSNRPNIPTHQSRWPLPPRVHLPPAQAFQQIATPPSQFSPPSTTGRQPSSSSIASMDPRFSAANMSLPARSSPTPPETSAQGLGSPIKEAPRTPANRSRHSINSSGSNMLIASPSSSPGIIHLTKSPGSDSPNWRAPLAVSPYQVQPQSATRPRRRKGVSTKVVPGADSFGKSSGSLGSRDRIVVGLNTPSSSSASSSSSTSSKSQSQPKISDDAFGKGTGSGIRSSGSSTSLTDAVLSLSVVDTASADSKVLERGKIGPFDPTLFFA